MVRTGHPGERDRSGCSTMVLAVACCPGYGADDDRVHQQRRPVKPAARVIDPGQAVGDRKRARTLQQETISEGIATAFDQAAFPGPPDPSAQAITPAQECTLWDKAKPQLGATNLYDLWMFGGPGVPHWTAFTIGYHIVNDYRNRHRDASWAQLTAASATAILAASHYQPCPPPGKG